MFCRPRPALCVRRRRPQNRGPFFLNGQGYIRMFQGNKLAPIKAGHKTIDIKQDAEFIPIGRVVAKM